MEATGMKRRRRWPFTRRSEMLMTSAGIAVLLAVLVYGASTLADGDVAAALLAFFGVLITTAAKHVVDRRSDQNIRLDAAMKAGALLNPSKDAPVSPAAAASGLLALAELDRAQLAVAMLIDLWQEGRVSEETAILVIDNALRGGRADASLVAAEALCKNACKLDPVKAAHWPSILDESWVPEASMQTKILLVEALVDMNISSEKSLNALRVFALRLYGILQHESHPPVKGCIAHLIGAIVPALEKSPFNTFLYAGETIQVGDLREATKGYEKNPDD